MSSIYNFIRDVCTDFFPSAEERERKRRAREELRDAAFNAEQIRITLSYFKRKVNERYPHRTDIISIANKMEQCLRDETGGELPEEFLYKFGYQVLKPQGNKTLKKIVERWSNTAEIRKEFSFLRSFNEKGEHIILPKDDMERRLIASTYATEEEASNTTMAIQNWIQDR